MWCVSPMRQGSRMVRQSNERMFVDEWVHPLLVRTDKGSCELFKRSVAPAKGKVV